MKCRGGRERRGFRTETIHSRLPFQTRTRVRGGGMLNRTREKIGCWELTPQTSVSPKVGNKVLG